MIGTSYAVDSSFIGQLPMKERDIAVMVLFDTKFIDMVHAIKDIKHFQARFEIPNQESANRILRACLLTKITYFEPLGLSPNKVEYICRVAAKILGTKSFSPLNLSAHTSTTHPVFSKWMRIASTKTVPKRNKQCS